MTALKTQSSLMPLAFDQFQAAAEYWVPGEIRGIAERGLLPYKALFSAPHFGSLWLSLWDPGPRWGSCRSRGTSSSELSPGPPRPQVTHGGLEACEWGFTGPRVPASLVARVCGTCREKERLVGFLRSLLSDSACFRDPARALGLGRPWGDSGVPSSLCPALLIKMKS